jgi:hypothetical protein
MAELIIQYILIVILVVVLGFLIYYLKDKQIIRDEDYYGITFSILSILDIKDSSRKKVKSILREVSDAVQFVECNFKGEKNEVKEERAIEIAREGIDSLKLNSKISDESVLYMIRLSCAILPPTHGDK